MTVWKEWDSWTYEYFDLDADPSLLPGFEDFVALWNKKRDDRPAPQWADYDWEDLKPWWSSLIIVDYFFDPFSYTYRLFGTAVVQRIGYDPSGMNTNDMTDNSYYVGDSLDFFEYISLNLKIARTSGTIHWRNRDHIECTFIEFPLSDTGERASHGLSLMI